MVLLLWRVYYFDDILMIDIQIDPIWNLPIEKPSETKIKKFQKFKFIEKANQGVNTRVFKSAEFKNDLCYVLRPLLHCVFALLLICPR